MIYDLSHQIVDEHGEPAKDEAGKPAELKTVLQKVLLAETPNQTPTSKLARFELYLKLKFAELKVELTTEEALLIKEVSSLYPVLVFGQIVHWIEGKLHKDQPK